MLKKISILNDNYIWIIYNIYKECVIIDPGTSNDVIKTIIKEKWTPIAILLTHKHKDHINGVEKIKKKYPEIIIYGPSEINHIPIDIIVYEGMVIKLLYRKFIVLFTPGHTYGHVSYYSNPYIFCGDVIFSGGCGYVDNNQYIEMYNSIKKILSLPNNTLLCCSHEYTLSNLIFSISIVPDDIEIKKYYILVKKKIKTKKSTLPTLLLYERKINLFLRTHETILKKSIGISDKSNSFKTFVALRLKKNLFKK